MRRLALALLLVLAWTAHAEAAAQQLLKGQTCADTTPRPCLVHVFVQDSSSTTGAGLTGLTNATANLVCYYMRTDQGNAGATQLTLSGGTLGTWSSGGFKEKDATNAPGEYELGLSTAMLATGSNVVRLHCKGATNMAPLVVEYQLTGYDPENATTLGLTNLDAAVSSRMATFTLPTNFSSFSIDASGRLDLGKWIGVAPNALSSGTVQADVEQWRTAVPNALINSRVPIAAQVQQNVALATFLFLMTDSTTHAPKTGVTVTCTRSIDGAAFAAGTLANVTEVANGFYRVDFGAGDLNGKNVVLRCTGTNADDAFVSLVTYP